MNDNLAIDQRSTAGETNTDSGNRTNSTFDKVKSTISTKLHEAADGLTGKVRSLAGDNPSATQYGDQAANWLNRSADYIDDITPGQIRNDVQKQVRDNPGRSLLIAAAAGLILGAVIRRR
jgi:ElaB/YqjD/DUF883 family membrane-anchored ribosome-binding protein